MENKKSKNKNKGKNIVIVIAILLAALLIFTIVKIFSNKTNKSHNLESANSIANSIVNDDVRFKYAVNDAKYVQRFKKNKDYVEFNELNLTGKSYGVYDFKTKEIIFEKNPNAKVVPYSTNKIYSLAFVLSELDDDEIVNVGDEIKLLKFNDSRADIKPGRYRVRQLVRGVLLPSGNDCMVALAVHRQKKHSKSIDPKVLLNEFNSDLNKFLKTKGIEDTKVFDSTGYSGDNETNVRDMFLGAIELVKYKVVNDNVNKKSGFVYSFDNDKTWVINGNPFVSPRSKYYNPRISGIKTGSKKDDVYNIVIRYTNKYGTYAILVFGQDNDEKRNRDVQKIVRVLDTIKR